MRVKDSEIAKIREVFEKNFQTPVDYRLFLFGSRSKDHLRGGDIDLLLLTRPEHLESIRKMKRKLVSDLFEAVGEQKVDLLIESTNADDQSEFARHVLATAIRIDSQR